MIGRIDMPAMTARSRTAPRRSGDGRQMPMPSVTRFLAGKVQIMALAEQRRAEALAPVPVRV